MPERKTLTSPWNAPQLNIAPPTFPTALRIIDNTDTLTLPQRATERAPERILLNLPPSQSTNDFRSRIYTLQIR